MKSIHELTSLDKARLLLAISTTDNINALTAELSCCGSKLDREYAPDTIHGKIVSIVEKLTPLEKSKLLLAMNEDGYKDRVWSAKPKQLPPASTEPERDIELEHYTVHGLRRLARERGMKSTWLASARRSQLIAMLNGAGHTS